MLGEADGRGALGRARCLGIHAGRFAAFDGRGFDVSVVNAYLDGTGVQLRDGYAEHSALPHR